VQHEVRVPIRASEDVVIARKQGRIFATKLGFLKGDPAIIAAAISELTSNILQYALEGEIIMQYAEKDGRKGIEIIATDNGPGISDVERSMEDGYSTSGRLGLGLPGTKRVMDEFEIVSLPGRGTTVTIRKWLK
jgi:serine/threonine-protein kinase RsbT